MKPNYYTYHVTQEGQVYNRHGKLLSPSDNGKGYLIVSITHKGRRTTKAIHRLVGEVYLPNPMKLSDVDHIDCDRRNNNVANLRWTTHGENIANSYKANNRSAVGEHNANSTHTEEDVHEICKMLAEGYSPPYIRDKGYSYSVVRSIKYRKRWLHISKDYSF